MRSAVAFAVTAGALALIVWVFTLSPTPPAGAALAQPLTAQTSVNLEPGFPFIAPGRACGAFHYNKVADIDTDGRLELFAPSGSLVPLLGLNADGTLIPGWPFTAPDSPCAGYIAFGDLLPSYTGLEVVFTYGSRVYIYQRSGEYIASNAFDQENFSPPLLVDIDANSRQEIFVSGSGSVYGFGSGLSLLPNWPIPLSGDTWVSKPTAIDVDANGDLEIVVVSRQSSTTTRLWAFHHNAVPVNGFPVSIDVPPVSNGAIAVGDVDGDGARELVLYNAIVGLDGQLEHALPLTNPTRPPALADLDGDSVPEIIAQAANGIFVFRGDGTMFPGWPLSIANDEPGGSGPVVGDLNGDYKPDIAFMARISGSCFGTLWVFDRDNQQIMFRNLAARGGSIPALGDIDGDGRTEIVVSGDSSCGEPSRMVVGERVWVYDLGGTTHGPVQWAQYSNDIANQGYYVAPTPFVDFTVGQQLPGTPVGLGDTFQTTITVSNRAPSRGQGVQLRQALPAAVNFVSASASQGSCSVANRVLTCNLGAFASGAQATVNLVLRAAETGPLTLAASVSGASEASSRTNNNTTRGSITIQPSRDIALTLLADDTTPIIGQTVTLTVTVRNGGPSTATNLRLQKRLPEGLNYVSHTASRGDYDAASGVWSVGRLAVNATASLTIQSVVQPGTGGWQLFSEASVLGSSQLDPDNNNNQASLFLQVIPNTPMPTSTRLPTATATALDATTQPDCSSGSIDGLIDSFQPFGVVQMRVQNHLDYPATLTGFSFGWVGEASSTPIHLARVTASIDSFGGPEEVVVWTASAEGEDAQPPTISGSEGTWQNDYTISGGAAFYLYLDFDGTLGAVEPAVFETNNFGWLEFDCGVVDLTSFLPTQQPPTQMPGTSTPHPLTTTPLLLLTVTRQPTATATIVHETPTPLPTWTPVPPALPVLIYPLNGQVLRRPPWFTVQEQYPYDADSFEIEVATDALFTNVVYFVNNPQTTFNGMTTMTDGTYYWRARSVKQFGARSAWTQPMMFIVDDNQPPMPVPVVPAPNAIVSANGLSLQWLAEQGAQRYQVQIDRVNPPMSNPIEIVAPRFVPFDLLPGGTYYWRVRVRDIGGDLSRWSPVRAFTVRSGANAVPLLYLTDSSPVLTWSRVTWATGYRVQVSPRPDFATLVVNRRLGAAMLQMTTPSLANGVYYWRVAALRGDGTSGPWSQSGMFRVSEP